MYFARSQIGDKLGQHITLQRRHEEPVEEPGRDVFKLGKGTATWQKPVREGWLLPCRTDERSSADGRAADMAMDSFEQPRLAERSEGSR